MSSKHIAVLILSLLLALLLGWMIVAGVGDIRTRAILASGIILGIVYTVFGRLPDWMVFLSLGRVTADDDPSNISPRLYLPLLGGAIVVAVVVTVIALKVL